MTARILVGHVLDKLAEMPDESVHMVWTSPPYHGLRSYRTEPQVWGGEKDCAHEWFEQRDSRPNASGGPSEKQESNAGTRQIEYTDRATYSSFCPRCSAWRGEHGLEPSFAAWLEHEVAIFREVRRVLRNDGTLFLNCGDSYVSAPNGRSAAATKDVGKDDRTFRDKPINTAGPVLDMTTPNVLQTKHPGGTTPQGRLRAAGIFKAKDRVLMPARLATELQKPFHTGPIKLETDRAWLAALMDGEGTISIRKHDSYSNGRGGNGRHTQDGFVPFISIANNDRELLDRTRLIVGCGTVGLKQKAGRDSRGIVNRRDCYGFRLDGPRAVEIARDIYPWLIVKRRQAGLICALQHSNSSMRAVRGKGPVPADEQTKRVLLWGTIKKCNQREEVDIPSWVKEPVPNVEQGWYLRDEIILSKKNPMPSSVKDRTCPAHEMLYMFSKRAKYFYDAVAIQEPAAYGYSTEAGAKIWNRCGGHTPGATTTPGEGGTRLRRSVWSSATEPFPGAHFATAPTAWVEPCILAGTSQRGVCSTCKAPWMRQVKHTTMVIDRSARTHDRGHTRSSGTMVSPPSAETTGWTASCKCEGNIPVPATVLDPFMGAGTTCMVAESLGRDSIGIELNPEYADMARARIRADLGRVKSTHPEREAAGALFER